MIKKLLGKFYRFTQRSSDPRYCWSLREKAIHGRGLGRQLAKLRYFNIMKKRCASIPLEAKFETMPSFPHGFNGILVSLGAEIGADCTIFHQVTIGSNTLAGTKRPGAPVIGDHVYIGAGAKIIGGVRVGDYARIGANCVVTDDIPDHATVVLPKPRVIVHDGEKGNEFVAYGEYAGR